MALLTILQFPDARLRRTAKPVAVIDEHIQAIIDDMFAANYAADNCAALAATQLDLADPPCITVIDLSQDKNQPVCLINPKIIERIGEQYEMEGCMSVGPGYIYDKVKRAAKIRVQALDRQGNELDFVAEGYYAKCIQHELDHLDGKLYIDHLSQLKRDRIRCKLRKQA
jgi:peptide deformylase